MRVQGKNLLRDLSLLESPGVAMEGHRSSSEAKAPFCSAAPRMVWMENGAKGETEAVQPFPGKDCV